LIWQFLLIQNVPLFPMTARQTKLNTSRSRESFMTEKVFAGPTFFGSWTLTDIPVGMVRSFLVTGGFDSESEESFSSASISSPETTVKGKPTIDFRDVPVREFLSLESSTLTPPSRQVRDSAPSMSKWERSPRKWGEEADALVDGMTKERKSVLRL
jgi:hypothetical protein